MQLIIVPEPESALALKDIVAAAVGLGGAVIGGAVGALMTGSVSRRLNAHAWETQQKERDRAAAFSMQQHLLRIYSACVDNIRHIRAGRDSMSTMKAPHLSLMVQPFANMPPRVEFTTDQLYSVNRMGGVDLLNATATLDQQHNAIVTAFETYRDVRMRVTESWVAERMSGPLMTTAFTPSEFGKFAPTLMMLDNLLDQVESMCTELYNESFDALKLLLKAKGAAFEERLKMSVGRLDGSTEDIDTLLDAPAKRQRLWWPLSRKAT